MPSFVGAAPARLSKGTHGHAQAARATPTWTFSARFRRGAFDWESDLPIQRLEEAAAENRVMVRKDPVLAADGAVCPSEKLSPAFDNVDYSIGGLQAVIRDVFGQVTGTTWQTCRSSDRQGVGLS